MLTVAFGASGAGGQVIDVHGCPREHEHGPGYKFGLRVTHGDGRATFVCWQCGACWEEDETTHLGEEALAFFLSAIKLALEQDAAVREARRILERST